MSVPAAVSPKSTGAIGLVAAGLLVAIGAWFLPANLKSVSPALLTAAGSGTTSVGAFGRYFVDLEKTGPATLVLAAAKATDDPRAPALAIAIDTLASRQPSLVAWGGW